MITKDMIRFQVVTSDAGLTEVRAFLEIRSRLSFYESAIDSPDGRFVSEAKDKLVKSLMKNIYGGLEFAMNDLEMLVCGMGPLLPSRAVMAQFGVIRGLLRGLLRGEIEEHQ